MSCYYDNTFHTEERESDYMKITQLAVVIENTGHERTFRSFCQENNILIYSSKKMNKREVYYYIFNAPSIQGQRVTSYPVQESADFILKNNLLTISANRFREIYNKCED